MYKDLVWSFGVFMFFLLLERIDQTVDIMKHTVGIEEKGIKLRLTIIDTPGFGDALDNTGWWAPDRSHGRAVAELAHFSATHFLLFYSQGSRVCPSAGRT